MDIELLRVVVTEDEANATAAREAQSSEDVDNLRLRFTPEGLVVTGRYTGGFIKLPFETRWEITVDAGTVVARLATLKVAGLPAGKFRGMILKVIQDTLGGPDAGCAVTDDAVRVDPSAALKARK